MTAQDLHVIPINDLRDHASQRTCWCRPVQDDEDDNVWVHNSLDERETYENGRAKQ